MNEELASHTREELRAGARSQVAMIERLRPEGIADAVAFIVTSRRRVAVGEVFVRAANQSWETAWVAGRSRQKGARVGEKVPASAERC
ncbi:hypothetical protein [Paractinoplanes brasiliensis]|uniref:hypothetical protein n=1 Tax=Paractinoplanes brasiliensis TaxID=52695 RepID=UPI001941E28D|nr:hypothetical protein [Actinoplanes brasiliensis]GID27912.1 hypothetical protein Abr02nite_28950 [Actinoplanes brasiliensis]